MFLRPRLAQSLAISGTSTATIPAPGACQHVRLAATTDCFVTLSSTGAAIPATAANGMLIRASTAGETFKIGVGDVISAIALTGTGTLNAAFMSN